MICYKSLTFPEVRAQTLHQRLAQPQMFSKVAVCYGDGSVELSVSVAQIGLARLALKSTVGFFFILSERGNDF
jgi:hypothetical protein